MYKTSGIFCRISGYSEILSLRGDLEFAARCPVGPENTRSKQRGGKWSWRWDSNPRPADYKSAALPTELRQPILVFARAAILFTLEIKCNYFFWFLCTFISFFAHAKELDYPCLPYRCSYCLPLSFERSRAIPQTRY